MSLIHNEQTKLTATFLNGMALAIFAVGGLGPMVTAAYGERGPSFFLLAMALYCLAAAFALHFMARRILRRLEP